MAALWNDPRIKTLFSRKVLENLNAAHVWSEGYNNNYVGELRGKGSTVRIFSFPRPDINDYDVPSADLSGGQITYQRLAPTAQELTIDQDKSWAIAEDRVQEMFASPAAFDALSREAGWHLSDVEDRDLAIRLHDGAGVVNPLGASTSVGFGTCDDNKAFTVMERLREELKNNRVPGQNLHVFCPDWFMTMIRVDRRFSDYGTEANRRTARGERILEVAGITIHETINALDGSGTGFSTGPDACDENTIVACWEGGATFVPYESATEMTDMIPASQNIWSHDNLMRARALWGAKVTLSEAVVRQVVSRGDYEA